MDFRVRKGEGSNEPFSHGLPKLPGLNSATKFPFNYLPRVLILLRQPGTLTGPDGKMQPDLTGIRPSGPVVEYL